MEKIVELKGGTTAVIRPMTVEDAERSFAFFRCLPESDRAYLRSDVTRPSIVEERIRRAEVFRIKRLVAIVGDRIVADGALESETYRWKEHVGEIRLIVARDFQRQGLGMLMARELFELAAREKLDEIIVKFMRPQIAARGIMERLGFEEETTLPGYVKDQSGQKQDLILMRCNLEAIWRRMERFTEQQDWRRSR